MKEIKLLNYLLQLSVTLGIYYQGFQAVSSCLSQMGEEKNP